MADKNIKQSRGGWIFLLVILGLYGALAIVNKEMCGQALSLSTKMMANLWLVLVMVFLLLLVADLLLKPEWVRRNLGRDAGLRGWLMAIVGGVLASGPIYAWYALLADLREKGLPMPLAAVFLYSRALKVPLLPLMIHYFGMVYTIVLCLYLLVFSIISGMLMMRLELHETD